MKSIGKKIEVAALLREFGKLDSIATFPVSTKDEYRSSRNTTGPPGHSVLEVLAY